MMQDDDYDEWLLKNRDKLEYDPDGPPTRKQLRYYRWLCTELGIPAGVAQDMLKFQYDTYGKLYKRIDDLKLMREFKRSTPKDQMANLFRALNVEIAATRKMITELREPPPEGVDGGAAEAAAGTPVATRVKAERGPWLPIGLVIGAAIVLVALVVLLFFLMRRGV